ncbi:Protogenin [Schistosoma japonicum]|nr:Protogenin [Schistosoma japonicum]KAH8850088.1 Protogenin [Schistosoma japonicum]
MATTTTTWSVLYISMVSFWIVVWLLNIYETSVLPEFQSVPESIVYYVANDHVNKSIEICCDIWPKWPIGRLTYYSTYHFHRSSDTANVISHQRSIYHVPSDFTCSHHSSGEDTLTFKNCLCFSNVTYAELFSGEKFYCMASTDFGSILSRPFQIVIENNAQIAEVTYVHYKLVYRLGNIAILPCNLEKLYLSDQIFFIFNNTEITTDLFNKYRLVQISRTGYSMFLIRDFNLEDQGFYQCGLLDSKLKSKRYDHVIYHLTVDNSSDPSSKSVLVMNLDGNLSNTDMFNDTVEPIEIIAYEGQNISLSCVFSSLKPCVANVSRVMDRLSDNQKFDYLFGVLDMYHLTKKDEGLYFCTADNITSYAYLQIIPSPQLIVYPHNVKANLGDSVNLSCISSGIDLAPTWYFNGILVQFTKSMNLYHTSLLIDSVQLSNIGIYQCVIEGNNIWMDGIITVSLPEESLFTRDEFYTALSKVVLPLHPKIDTYEVKIGDVKQLECLSSDDLDLHYGGDIPRSLNNLLPFGNNNSLFERLNISCHLNLVSVKWLNDGRSNTVLSMHNNASYHKLQCSTLHIFNIHVNQSNDFGVYSCNVYFGEQLVFKRYFRLIQSIVSSYSWSNDVNFKHPTNNLHDSFNRRYNVFHNEQANIPLYRIRRSQDHKINDWSFPSEHINPLPLLNLSFPKNSYEHLRKPNATTFGDNLAVLISWNSIYCDFYRIILRSRIPESNGLIHRSTIDETVEECCKHDTTCCLKTKHFYLTNRHPGELVPGKSYQFRIHAFEHRNGHDQFIDKSPWSEPVSFQHISKVAPVITETERLSDGGILTRWTLATSAVGFPVDHFLLLYRPEERSANGSITYNGFKAVLVDGSNAREYKLQALESGKGYQIVVYGVYTPPGFDPQSTIFTGGLNGRKITQFSHEVFVKPRSISVSTNKNPDNNYEQDSTLRSIAKSREYYSTKNVIAFNSSESNRLMFLIFGALTGVMLLIMICLVVLCVWRQRRNKHCLVMNHSTSGCNIISCNSDTTDKTLKKNGFNVVTGSFLLDNLNTTNLMTSSYTNSCENRKIDINVEHCRDNFSDKRISHNRSRPPPLSPAPPPPASHLSTSKYLTANDNFELRSLMSENDDMLNNNNRRQHTDNMSKSVCLASSYFHPNNPSPLPPLFSPPVCHTKVHRRNHSVVVDNSFSYPHLLLSSPTNGDIAVATSALNKSIGELDDADHLTNQETSNCLLQTAILNGLKREPPSGGSMHGGTDDEFGLTPDKYPINNQPEYPHSTEFCSYLHQNPTVSYSLHRDVGTISDSAHLSHASDGRTPMIIVSCRDYNVYPNNFRSTKLSYMNDPSLHQQQYHPSGPHSNQLHCYHCQNSDHLHNINDSCSPNLFVNVHNPTVNEFQHQQPSNIMFTSTIPNYDPGLLTPPSPDIIHANNDHDNKMNLYVNHHQYPNVFHTRRRHPRSSSCHFGQTHYHHQEQQPFSSSYINPAMITSFNNNLENGVKYFGLSQSTNHRHHRNPRNSSVPYAASNSQQNSNVSISES